MKKESEKYNNPDDFAKYGKMQRQLLKREKELKKLKEMADKSMLDPNAEFITEGGDDDDQLLIEEAKNTEDDPPLVPDSIVKKKEEIPVEP